MAQFFETLHYKPEGREFDYRWGQWDFLLTEFFRRHYGPEVGSTFNRTEYQEYLLGGVDGRRVEPTTLLFSHAGCLGILGASTSWSSQDLSRPVMG